MDANASANPRSRAKTRVSPKGLEFGHRKSPSFTSSSSSNSSSSSSLFLPDDSTPRSRPSPSPSTQLRLPSSSGVPFSWEKLPGIPKRQTSCRRSDSAASLKLIKLLPLPPTATPRKSGHPAGVSSRKKSSPEWDPFVAALVECSKDDGHRRRHHSHRQEENVSGSLWAGTKVCRSISDRFGFFGILASCKRTCDVKESVTYVPRPRRTTANNPYGLIKYHHHGSIDK